MSSLHEVGRFSYRKTHEPPVSLFSFQPTRAKHKKSFNKNAFWFHLEAKKPVFLGSGHWVFVGPTCPLRCCTLFTMAENCSKTSCIQTPRGDQKRRRNSAILGAQTFTPYGFELRTGDIFCGGFNRMKV